MHDSHPEVVVFWSDKSNEIEMRKEEKEFGDLLENGDARRLWNWYEEAKDNITVVTVLFASALCFAVEFILSARNVQGDFIEWTTGDKLERWAGILLGVVLIFVLSGIVAGIFVNFVALNKKTFAICAMVVVASILIVCDILGHGADRQVDEKVKEAYAAGYSEGCEEGSNSGGIG